MRPETITLHGRTLSYVKTGSGPLLLLIHGVAGTHDNWQAVIEPLAQRHAVLAPDLPGHGESAGGAGDYSLGSMAASLRDLLMALGHERATLVGHSLGGGIAMQFAYQFPELTERLVLVSSGGLGEEVSAVLRAATLPGANLFIAATATAGSSVGGALGRGLARVGLRPSADVAEIARGYASLADPDRRAAFLATLRSVVGTGGQRVDAGDRLYLSDGIPVLIVWGARDPIIPVSHGQHAHAAMPGSRLEVFDGVGHMPQVEVPVRFIAALERFVAETEPARFDPDEWRTRFRRTPSKAAARPRSVARVKSAAVAKAAARARPVAHVTPAAVKAAARARPVARAKPAADAKAPTVGTPPTAAKPPSRARPGAGTGKLSR